eukprot:SAG11_NODE_11_length_27870_cov_16.327428_12_plen_167_part_00
MPLLAQGADACGAEFWIAAWPAAYSARSAAVEVGWAVRMQLPADRWHQIDPRARARRGSRPSKAWQWCAKRFNGALALSRWMFVSPQLHCVNNPALLGDVVWGASIALAIWLSQQPGILEGRSVLELGAGLGLPGLVSLQHHRRLPRRRLSQQEGVTARGCPHHLR